MTKVAHVYEASAIVAACPYFPKFYIKASRKDDKEPAHISEKISTWVSGIIIVAIVSFIYSMNGNNFTEGLSYFLAAFIKLFIPTAYSISYGHQKDSKLTIEQRRKIKKEVEDLDRKS